MISGPRSAEGPRRRVVITGMGVIAPSGCDLPTFWDNVRHGRSAVAPITRFDASESPSQLAAEVQNWDPSPYMDPKAAKRSERSLHYGIAAADLAWRDAGLDMSKMDPARAGIVEATSLSNLDAAYRAREALDARGLRAVSPSM